MLHRLALAVAACAILFATPAVAAEADLPPGGTFIDDDGSVHEGNIEAMARAGITRGCNPPTNDRYCPNDTVTRAQMAAFLVRGLNLTDIDPGIAFTDTAGSTFENDILKLATAGITKGCNPPTNDRYCPNDTVTRAQMASFLARGLELSELRPPPIAAPGTLRVQLKVEGSTRTYTLHMPRRVSRYVPLVLDLHGLGGTPAGQEATSRFSIKGAEEGFAVAQPAALGSLPRWNITTGSGAQTDVAFLRALIEDVAKVLPIDRQAVFAAGFSNGGGMVHRFACEASDVVVAIGVVAGQQVLSDTCTPASPVAVTAIHGTSDPIVPYAGDGFLFPSIDSWIEGWAGRNACTTDPTVSRLEPDVARKRWSECTANATVELHTIDSGQHRWPSVPPDSMSATDVLWDFFSAHTRK